MLIIPISVIMVFISAVLLGFLSNCPHFIDKQLDNIFLALLDEAANAAEKALAA
jgi:hypothetical protein